MDEQEFRLWCQEVDREASLRKLPIPTQVASMDLLRQSCARGISPAEFVQSALNQQQQQGSPYPRSGPIGIKEPDQMGFMDKQFGMTSVVVLVLAGICCSFPMFVFGLVGILTCKEQKAKSRATLLTIVALIALAAAIGFSVISRLNR